MPKIGEFSRLSQVTIKTLHHYDELGLIKPAHIDPITNYRFYTVEQLPRWNWLPLVAGAWILLPPLLVGIMGSPSPTVFIAVLVMMTVAQIMLGYILQADASLKTVTT